jgi:DNA-binding NtrC family response regulator
LSANEIEVLAFVDVNAALVEANAEGVVAAVIVGDGGNAVESIERLREKNPGIEIVVATRFGVPLHVGMVLHAGASTVLDIRANNDSEMVAQLQEAAKRHDRNHKERDLLLKLRHMNDEFLKNVVALEQRNIDLERSINQQVETFDSDDADDTRILLIDDEPAVRQLFALILEDNFQLTAAEDGEQGLKLFKEKPFPLVVTDKNLPGIDGHEVLRAIKRLRPDTDVVMITGYASKESAIEAVNTGATAYLEKPFTNVDMVVAKLESVVNDRRTRVRKARYLNVIKERNRGFLERYRSIRTDLDAWLRDWSAEARKQSEGVGPGGAAPPGTQEGGK